MLKKDLKVLCVWGICAICLGFWGVLPDACIRRDPLLVTAEASADIGKSLKSLTAVREGGCAAEAADLAGGAADEPVMQQQFEKSSSVSQSFLEKIRYRVLLPWKLYDKLIHGFLAGKISVWLSVFWGLAGVFGAAVFVFLLALLLRWCQAPAFMVYFLCVFVALTGVLSAVYPWFFPPYTFGFVVIRIVWTWLFFAGGVYSALMLAMLGNCRARS